MLVKFCVTYLCIALLGSSAARAEARIPPGPAMVVDFDYYPRDEARIHVLEKRLADAIKRSGAGELAETELHVDGNKCSPSTQVISNVELVPPSRTTLEMSEVLADLPSLRV
ncbi:hypothetical protein [Burkholderia multivorans]|nr:hypothetical protein [Burkholderia multivorans]